MMNRAQLLLRKPCLFGILALLISTSFIACELPTDEEQDGGTSTPPQPDAGSRSDNPTGSDLNTDPTADRDTGFGEETDGSDTGGDIVLPDTDSGDIGGTDPVDPLHQPPVLNSATAQSSGRWAQDLYLVLSGTDVDGDVVGIALHVLDSSGDDVLAFDSDRDGDPDSAERNYSLDSDLDRITDFETTTVITSLLMDYPWIEQVEITLIDGEGATSVPLQVTITTQVERALGESCDPELLADLCQEGLGCNSESLTCAAGTPPELTQFAYIRDDMGPLILSLGIDIDDDIASILLEFLDTDDSAISLDLDNDGNPESTSFSIDARYSGGDGTFFRGMQGAETLAELVPRLAATPIDSGDRRGARQVSNLTGPQVRTTGSSCDHRGFDICQSGRTCYPGLDAEPSQCVMNHVARAQECNAAPRVTPNGSTLVIEGDVEGASLWEPPIGCASEVAVSRPEAIAVLELDTPASSVTITTNVAGTNFDTVLYVFEGCESATPTPLDCIDDSEGNIASTLTLTDLPAGEYALVIDSWGDDGGRYVLNIDVVQ